MVGLEIWCQHHKSINTPCLVSIVQADLIVDHVHPFMAIICSSTNGYFQHDNTCKK